ncbi:MAG: diaminopimelate epimerase [Actinomycetota bacterium]
MGVQFSKYHGLGNDFLLVFGREVTPQLAIHMCDRHFGVGADGVIQIGPSRSADFSFRLLNADGSPAEVSGNGLRCVGKFLFDKGHHRETTLKMEVAGEVRALELVVNDGEVTAVRADMGVPTGLGEVELHGLVWRLIETGNPHAVTMVEDINAAPVEAIGPLVEKDPAFPNRTNVEFVQVLGNELQVRFWERGVGPTLASGSGSCAAAVASGLKSATVHTLGGDLFVEHESSGRLYMTGPAVHVFDAELSDQVSRDL